MDQFDVGRRTDEGQRNEVHPQLQSEAQVSDILLRQSRHRDVHPRQGNTLVVRDRTALDDTAHHIIAIYLDALQAHLTVVDKQAIARTGIISEVLVRGGNAVVRAFDIVDGDAHNLAVSPIRRAFLKTTEANLWPLQIGENTNRTSRSIGCFTHPAVVLSVVLMLTVREIQPGNIHAGVDQPGNPLQ